MRKIRKRPIRNRAVSPVIATVIIVAITITVAVAVAYWMSSIAGQFTEFEQVEIQAGYATIEPNPGGWIITLELKNTGTKTATLISVFVNDVPVDLYGTTFALTQAETTIGENTGTNIPAVGLSIESGKISNVGDTSPATPVQVYIGSGLFSSGTTVNIKIHSAGGMDYIKLIGLV